MLIGIYGGSFNPIHFGHIGLSRWVLEHTSLNEVWLMVSPSNPLKDAHTLAPEDERLAGARAAIEASIAACPLPEGKRLLASDYEFSLPRPSYTARTLGMLSESYPEHQFALIIGEDNYSLFPRWRDWEAILRTYPLYVYPRHGEAHQFEPLPGFPAPHYMAGAPYFDISSTEIRQAQKK